ncbi:hypothetical protein GCM10027612_32690 [Microbispora bryophytorum subsp. camponoti]
MSLVHAAVMKACRSAKVALSRLRGVVIGTPGVVDPRTGDVRFSFDLPQWHEGIHEALARDLRRDVTIENDVNLAAIAERAKGSAREVDDFVLVWVGRGIGLAVVLGGRLHRGRSGSAGRSATSRCPACRSRTTSERCPGGCRRSGAACSRWSAPRPSPNWPAGTASPGTPPPTA